MIVLTVQSFNGQPATGPSASFDEIGGTIGRADNNQLVLPDPDRSISRVHAQVVFRNGGYAVVDRGSNPVLVNGQPLGNGRERPIRDGDMLQIGGYRLQVSYGHKTAPAADPFADLFNTAPATQPAVRHPRPAVPSTSPPAPPMPPAPQGMAAPSRPPAAAATIPEDWDPFAPSPPPTPLGTAAPAAPSGFDFDFGAPAPAGGANPYIPDLPVAAPSRADTLDALFDLGGSNSGSPPPADPFAQTPVAASLRGPNTLGDEDPLRAFGIVPEASPPPASDHVPDLNTPWPARPLRERPSREALAFDPRTMPAAPPGAVLSWDNPSRGVKVVTLPGVRRGEAPSDGSPGNTGASPMPPAGSGPGAARSAGLPESQGNAGPPPVSSTPAVSGLGAARPWGQSEDAEPLTRIVPGKPAPTPGTGQTPSPSPLHAAAVNADAAALLAAFADGLGVPDLKLAPLDAAQMRLVGGLLRMAVQGSVELLGARAAVKREVRADVTMIAARENNPLKFSPDADAALQHLLGVRRPGFMAPEDAMRDAFDDLRAHQLGVMAGMRAALEGVLQRFDPAVLEGKIARRSGLANLMSNRKALLWEQFQHLYTQLSAEAADDFQELFGKAFRRAYEAHIDHLQKR